MGQKVSQEESRKDLTPMVVVLLLQLLWVGAAVGSETPKILILNSYHQGYSWSDEMVDSIESVVLHEYPGADIRLEHLDAKRNQSAEYFELLASIYQRKFGQHEFDLVFACDDYSIDFILQYSDSLFPDVPIVFSGANRVDLSKINAKPNMTGVLEVADIISTINLALTFQPQAKELVVINDATFTGKFIGEEFQKLLPEIEKKVKVTVYEGEPFDTLEEKVSKLGDDALVLLLVYIRDNEGGVYAPSLVASSLSRVSPVPIYGVWDFYFNHGIVGGVMTSGYLQGEVAAKMGNQILDGKDVSELSIVATESSRLLIDYRQLERFGLAIEKLPSDAIVKNINYGKQKNVLLLHSYSQDNPWTSEVSRGLMDSLSATELDIQTHSEYMDTKRFSDKPYLNKWAKLLRYKYDQQDIDLVVTSDDNALNFIRRHSSVMFKGLPIVFCGVNFLQNPQEVTAYNITGVMESYDILGTLKLGLKLAPKTQKVFVINDFTTTGLANQKRLEQVFEQLPVNLDFHYSGDISMQQLLQKVEKLDENTLVLLMSFTQDKDNYRFGYQESAKLISSHSRRPVLGFWDFYLGCGVLGGVMTGGFDQGKTAGNLGISVLEGTSPGNIPVVEDSPVTAVVDYAIAEKFNLDLSSLSNEVELVNRPVSFFYQYRRYIYAAVAMVAIMLVLLLLQAMKILGQTKTNQALSVKAELDPLTGVKNREYYSSNIGALLNRALFRREPLTLCFFDLDNLKTINDQYGHKAGDKYILLAVEAIQTQIRSGDMLCRIGGDEFIAVLQNCRQDRGRALCGLAQIRLAELAKEQGLSWPVSISYGVSEFDLDNPVTPEYLMQQADSSMYQNKSSKKATG